MPEGPTSRRLKVFLCHASGDKPAVRSLYERLTQDGFQPWLDAEDLMPGQNWRHEIPKAVGSADVVLVCLSQQSISKEGYVQKEIRFALDAADEKPEGTIFLIPVKLEECAVPERLSDWHWVDLQGNGYEKLLRSLGHRARSLGLETSPSGVVAGTVKTNPKDGLNYVWIPPGKFMMGCSPGDTECYEDEKPAHEVEISTGFWMSQTQVTVAAWKRYRAATGKPALPISAGDWKNLNEASGDDKMPAVTMTWDEAREFCQWAGGRLPTEAEWEYAARAGSTGARYGDLDDIAWYADNSGRKRIDSQSMWDKDKASYLKRLFENGNGPHPAGVKKPNAWKLYDMLGNVWEWTADWYGENYYEQNQGRDPKGPDNGSLRVLRGGSWYSNPRYVRVSYRSRNDAPFRYNYIGFRCVGESVFP